MPIYHISCHNSSPVQGQLNQVKHFLECRVWVGPAHDCVAYEHFRFISSSDGLRFHSLNRSVSSSFRVRMMQRYNMRTQPTIIEHHTMGTTRKHKHSIAVFFIQKKTNIFPDESCRLPRSLFHDSVRAKLVADDAARQDEMSQGKTDASTLEFYGLDTGQKSCCSQQNLMYRASRCCVRRNRKGRCPA